MRKAKIGDVFAVKVPNGYKLLQWAYDIDKYGTYVRVFDGLYPTIPANIAEIIDGPHSYIADLFVGRAYRIGLLEWLGNYNVPEKYPFPEYAISFCPNQSGIAFIQIYTTIFASGFPQSFTFKVNSIMELPEQYRNVNLLHTSVSPDKLLYLFDNDFTPLCPKIFYPVFYWGDEWRNRYQVYIDIVADALGRDPKSKGLLKKYLQNTHFSS